MAVAAGDFNGDGHLDLAVTNYDAGNVGISVGYGDGTFAEPARFATGSDSYPRSVVVNDFNGDSHLDLALSKDDSPRVMILSGRGDGNFEILTVLAIPNEDALLLLVTDDFNGDTYPDLAIINYDYMQLGVVFGNNSRTLSRKIALSPNDCDMPLSAAAADFNGDGQLDLVLTNWQNFMCVLFGDGTGHFGETLTFAPGQYDEPEGIAVADFDRDGRFDLAISNYGTNTAAIMLGNGNGTFGSPVVFSTGAYSHPKWIVVNDFNADGHLDIAVCNEYAYNVGIFLGIGNGSFSSRIALLTGSNSMPVFISVGDFNHDGRFDLAVADYRQDYIYIFGNTCDCCEL